MTDNNSRIRRKRQVEGRRHDHRVDVYLSPEEKEQLRKAAQKADMSVSQFAVIAIKNALSGIAPDTMPDFEPVEISGEPVSATILRDRR
jgi:uncharacterized protein (DUF1778 family)